MNLVIPNNVERPLADNLSSIATDSVLSLPKSMDGSVLAFLKCMDGQIKSDKSGKQITVRLNPPLDFFNVENLKAVH